MVALIVAEACSAPVVVAVPLHGPWVVMPVVALDTSDGAAPGSVIVGGHVGMADIRRSKKKDGELLSPGNEVNGNDEKPDFNRYEVP